MKGAAGGAGNVEKAKGYGHDGALEGPDAGKRRGGRHVAGSS